MLKRVRTFVNCKLATWRAALSEMPDRYDRRFISHNRKVWRGYRTDRSGGEVLIEANRMGGCNVAMSYVASYLGQSERAKLVVFYKNLSDASKAIYESFADSFHRVNLQEYEAQVETKFRQVYPSIRSKHDLENLCVDGILIGDLVYDTYIRQFDMATVDLSTPEFERVLREGLGLLFQWRAYFKRHMVKAIIVSHGIYTWAGIITRVAVDAGIPAYLVQMNRVYRIDEAHGVLPYNGHVDYPAQFGKLSPDEQARARTMAKGRIAQRLKGERDVGKHHLLRLNYAATTGSRVLPETGRLKVLVASHCFADGSHMYGMSLLPDFYEWLQFLGTISERTNYDWYIKLHPDRNRWETAHVEAFAGRYPKFKILPEGTSHNQLVADGINCVLTVYGTIAFEYAAMGIPVVTASPWNPTMAYTFNVHPRTLPEYEHILMNLRDLHVTVDPDQVAEYYYCHYMDTGDDWLYDDLSGIYSDMLARDGVKGSLAYDLFLRQFDIAKHQSILATVERFVRSGDYCLRPVHFVRVPPNSNEVSLQGGKGQSC